jgi:hypothetical protein
MNGTSVLINLAIFQVDAFEADRTKERVLSSHSALRTLERVDCTLIEDGRFAISSENYTQKYGITQLRRAVMRF